MAAAMTMPARAGDGEASVNAFVGACVPERPVDAGALLTGAREEGRRITSGPRLFTRTVEDRPLHLSVGRSNLKDRKDLRVFPGLCLHDCDAAGRVAPEAVTRLAEYPAGRTVSQGGMTGHAWARPRAMPRGQDLYLAFVEQGSAAAGKTGHSGLMLKFDTSEPGPDEVVPATYC